jgi:glycosyltransferase involved in cell wall biosynthesis
MSKASRPSHVALNALFYEPNRSAGTETYLHGLVPALAEEFPALRITLVTTRKGAAQLTAQGWQEFCEIVQLPADEGQRLRRLVAEQVIFPRLARRRDCQLLHSLASVAPVRSRLPSVITLHDVIFFHHRTLSALTTFGMRQIVGRAALRAEVLIAISAAARSEICTTLRVSPERVLLVPNGPGQSPTTAPLPRGELDARLGLPPRARLVLCVAALRPHKNQELLVRALPELPGDVVLVLAGHREPYSEDVSRLAAALGVDDRVRVTGYVGAAELEALWKAAACAAFPTRAEGFGLPVLEAMQRGVAVACSDIPVLREVGGDVPRYFDPDDPGSAAQTIAALLAEPGEKKAGEERAARFSWAETARGTYEAYARGLSAPQA